MTLILPTDLRFGGEDVLGRAEPGRVAGYYTGSTYPAVQR